MTRQQRLARVARQESARAQARIDALYAKVLDTASPVCFNENMSEFHITDKTDINTTTIVTIEQGFSKQRWTLVSTADGIDMMVGPDGTHYDEVAILDADRDASALGRVVAWIMNSDI